MKFKINKTHNQGKIHAVDTDNKILCLDRPPAHPLLWDWIEASKANMKSQWFCKKCKRLLET